MHSNTPETLNKTSVETEVEVDVSYRSRKNLFLPLFLMSAFASKSERSR